jgi:signal transduction histidine kinase
MKKDETFTNVIRLATLLAHNDTMGYINDLEERLSRINQLTDLLDLNKEQVDEISSSLLAETVNVARYLGIDIGDIEDMLIKANKEIWHTYLMVENLFKERQELSRKLLQEERSKGAIESKNIALATLSHYLNNATMAIYGRTQIMRKHKDTGKSDQVLEKLGANLDVMEQAIWKIAAVLAEMKEISPIDDVEYYNMSQAMNLDDRIRSRMEMLAAESGHTVPKETVGTA